MIWQILFDYYKKQVEQLTVKMSLKIHFNWIYGSRLKVKYL